MAIEKCTPCVQRSEDPVRLLNLFRNQKERACKECQHFTVHSERIDFDLGEYMTLHEGSCTVYGKFNTAHTGHLDNRFFDERPAYELMLCEKAAACNHFEKASKFPWSFRSIWDFLL